MSYKRPEGPLGYYLSGLIDGFCTHLGSLFLFWGRRWGECREGCKRDRLIGFELAGEGEGGCRNAKVEGEVDESVDGRICEGGGERIRLEVLPSDGAL